jgi:hypothetical protein
MDECLWNAVQDGCSMCRCSQVLSRLNCELRPKQQMRMNINSIQAGCPPEDNDIDNSPTIQAIDVTSSQYPSLSCPSVLDRLLPPHERD